MSTIPREPTRERSEARRRVESRCQSLVDAGTAQWRINEDGDTELHLESGEAWRFGELGVTRLK